MKVLLAALIITQISIAQSFFSGGMGNGGHPYEIQFKNDAKTILTLLQRSDIELNEKLKSIDLYSLQLNIELVEVEVKRRKLKDKFGRVKSALNFPGKRLIQINKADWEKIKDIDSIRLPLVLHEYLGISLEEVDSYNISSSFYSFMMKVIKNDKLELKKASELAKKERNSALQLRSQSIIKKQVDLSKKNSVSSVEIFKRDFPGVSIVYFSDEQLFFLYQETLNLLVEKGQPLDMSNHDLEYTCQILGFNTFVGVDKDYRSSTSRVVILQGLANETPRIFANWRKGSINSLFCANL